MARLASPHPQWGAHRHISAKLMVHYRTAILLVHQHQDLDRDLQALPACTVHSSYLWLIATAPLAAPTLSMPNEMR